MHVPVATSVAEPTDLSHKRALETSGEAQEARTRALHAHVRVPLSLTTNTTENFGSYAREARIADPATPLSSSASPAPPDVHTCAFATSFTVSFITSGKRTSGIVP